MSNGFRRNGVFICFVFGLFCFVVLHKRLRAIPGIYGYRLHYGLSDIDLHGCVIVSGLGMVIFKLGDWNYTYPVEFEAYSPQHGALYHLQSTGLSLNRAGCPRRNKISPNDGGIPFGG